MQLITKEHSTLKEEKLVTAEYEAVEQEERQSFSFLSKALKASHKQEREYSEKTKYWSVIGSLCGAAIGVLGATINNYVRLREVRGIVKDATHRSIGDSLTGLFEVMSVSQSDMNGVVTELESKLSELENRKTECSKAEASYQNLEHQLKNLQDCAKQNEFLFQEQVKVLKSVADPKYITDNENVVYVGPNMQDMLDETSLRIENRLRRNSAVTVAFVCGGFALATAFVYVVTRGT